MSDNDFEYVMLRIIKALRLAGYEPYNQLKGYVQTGDAGYITRTNNARDLITQLDIEQIKEYLQRNY